MDFYQMLHMLRPKMCVMRWKIKFFLSIFYMNSLCYFIYEF